ncbi:MAG: tryptophan 7-halogenase [Planctomycetaceae bacterium]|nr:tryptophan 7-halogenase [Planctomycetaceae bacterium]
MVTLDQLHTRKADVAIIGGGPAGATAATLLAGAGHSVVLFERETVPRFHVGESLIPATYWTLQRLGLIERLKQSAFPRKFSVQFVTETGKITSPFYFDEFRPHESSQTWQVWRDDFDQMLLENAEARGAQVVQQAHVSDVIFDGEHARGVRVRSAVGAAAEEPIEVQARVVVDASGQTTFLANRLKLKRPDPRLKKGTVWGYFRGAVRDSGRDEGATIILQTEGKRSWFWNIPLPDDMVSIGCTGSLKYMFPGAGSDAHSVWEREVARCPAIQHRLANATLEGPLRTTRDFSYHTTRSAGDGWVLVGDAQSFIDPVYSSGVYLALKSGEMAADAIAEGLALNDISGERLGSWKKKYDKGVGLFHKLVYAFYSPGFSFGSLLREHPECKDQLASILMGNVFEPGVETLFDIVGDAVPPRDDELVPAT